jgi:acetyl esterase/lipase
VLRASGEAFAEHLHQAQVAVDASTLLGTTHGFLGHPDTAGFRDGITSMCHWIARPEQR